MIGQSIGHYKILEKLGEGGMGEVYRAEDTTLKRQVALKVLPPDLASNQERLDRFQREAETLAALDHPNIVTVFTVEHDEDIHFLTMQLVEGKRISELIPQGGMPLDRIFRIATPLADALATAHDKGIIHRDLKPANVMVTNEGQVKVLDFGLAKLGQKAVPLDATNLPTEPLTEEGRIVGTVPYMSPEQLEGKEVDARTDLFSLGVVLYEMATGDRPFHGDTSVSLMSSIVKDTPEAPDLRRPELPHHLGRIIQRCLEKEPSNRYQTMRDAVLELSNLRKETESSTVSGVATQASHLGETPSRRRGFAWILAATMILFLGSFAVWKLADNWSAASLEDTSSTTPSERRISDPKSRVLYEQAEQYRRDAESIAQWELAETTLRRALGLEPENPWLKAELAGYLVDRQQAHPQAERKEEALNLADQALQADPDLAAAWVVRGRLAKLEGDYQTALEAARQARSIDPMDHEAAYLLGRTLISQGSKEEGLAEIKQATELDDDPANVHFELGYALQNLGQLDEAILEYKQVTEYAPGHSSALNNLAVCYFWMGRYREAVPVFRRLLEIQPEDAGVASNLGTVYYYLDRMEEAIGAYEVAHRLDPGEPMIQNNLGDAHTKLGNLEKAREWYLKAIASADQGLSQGGSRLGLQQLKYLCLAKVGRFKESIAGVEAMAKDHPSDFEVLYTSAQVFALAGEKARLLEYTERAIRAGYPREEFGRAPEFGAFADDSDFQELLSADLESR